MLKIGRRTGPALARIRDIAPKRETQIHTSTLLKILSQILVITQFHAHNQKVEQLANAARL